MSFLPKNPIFIYGFSPTPRAYAGITLYPFIFTWYQRDEVPESFIRHELEHVAQIQRIGWFSFYASYLLYFLAELFVTKNFTLAYWNIPFEKAARNAELTTPENPTPNIPPVENPPVPNPPMPNPPTPPPTPLPDVAVLSLPASKASDLVSPMKLVSDSKASTGSAIYSDERDNGSANFKFVVKDAGLYHLRAEVLASSSSSDSFYIQVVGQSETIWHLPASSSYAIVQSTAEYDLDVGEVIVRVRGREPNASLAKLELVKVAGGSSGGGSPTPTPPPAPTPTPTPTPPPPPPTPTPGLDPNSAPGRNFDLSLWKITLPIDSSGGMSGTAMEVKPLPKDYEKEPYFYTASDGGMIFMAPVNGATTSGSKYPRSELREMKADGNKAAWTVEQGGKLAATLAVNELPVKSDGSKGRVVVGQIHGPDDELCRLYYDNGQLSFYDDKAGSSPKETQFILKSSSGQVTQIPLNAKFSYSIVADKSNLTVTAQYNDVTYTAKEPISSFWPGKALYFKAGIYVQVGKPGSGAGSTGSGQGKATFYSLKLN